MSNEVENNNTVSEPWILTMIVVAMIGAAIISIIGIHAIYNIYHRNINKGVSRYLYVSGFISFWLVCIGYAFFRTDLILPMGSIINCKIGFYLTTNGYFISKVLLLSIFLTRIDSVFGTSALGYSKSFLIITFIIIVLIVLILNILFVYDSWYMITLQSVSNSNIRVCTTGISRHTLKVIILILLFLMDITSSLFVCALFIYKLRKLIALRVSTTDNGIKPNISKFSKLIRKQTILVIIACLSSFIVMVVGVAFPPIALLVHVDVVINSFCVYMLFSFSDKIWNRIMDICCYCCLYCGELDDYRITIREKPKILSGTVKQQKSTDNVQLSNVETIPNCI
eukprot:432520_1